MYVLVCIFVFFQLLYIFYIMYPQLFSIPAIDHFSLLENYLLLLFTLLGVVEGNGEGNR